MTWLLAVVALTGGPMACTTHKSDAGQTGRELVKNHSAEDHDPAQLHGVQKGWRQVDPATERYCEKVTVLLNTKWDEYHAMNPGVLPQRGALRTVLTINKWGEVEDISVLNSEWSYPALTQLALRAVNHTKLPPMPAAVLSSLPTQKHGRLKIEYMAVCPPPR